jgi:integration host factor subunit alpha
LGIHFENYGRQQIMTTTEQVSITRAHLANKINQRLGYSRSEASEVIDAAFEEIITALCEEGEVKISSFGTFQVRQKPQRVGRNPKNKKEAPISARKAVSFYASNLLKKNLNNV